MKGITQLTPNTRCLFILSLACIQVFTLALVCPAAAGVGDIDANGTIELRDAIYAIQVSVGIEPAVEIDIDADVNGDGKIGIAEAIYIMLVLAGVKNDGNQGHVVLSVQHENSMPVRLARGPNDTFFVTDAKAGSVFMYDRDLNLVGELKNLDKPLGVAVDADGNIYVGNNGRDNVEVYGSDGEKLSVIGDGAIQMPNDLAFDQAGNLYVVDSLSNNVKVYDADGNWLRDIGGLVPGECDGVMQFPTALMVAEYQGAEELFVADQGHAKVQVFDLAGSCKRAFGEPVGAFSSAWQGQFAKIQSLAMDSQERLHAADCYLNKIQILNAGTGQYINYYGTYGPDAGELNLPLDILIAGQDVVVTNAGNRRVEKIHTIP